MRLGAPWRNVNQGGYEVPSSWLTESLQGRQSSTEPCQKVRENKERLFWPEKVHLNPDLEVFENKIPWEDLSEDLDLS